jgi:hypothetical protein
VEAGGLRVHGHPGLHRDPFSKNQRKKKARDNKMTFVNLFLNRRRD